MGALVYRTRTWLSTSILGQSQGLWIVPVVTLASAGFVAIVTWLAPSDQRAGFAAASAAVATLAVIAWQSRTSGRAARAAEAGLATTTKALDEAERGRLDQQGPRTWVTLGPVSWPPLEPSVAGGEPNQFPLNTEFALPGQAGHLIMLVAEGTICNEGDQTVSVTFSGSFRFRQQAPAVIDQDLGWDRPVVGGTLQRSLSPGTEMQFRLEDALSAASWRTNTEAATRGEVAPHVMVGEIIVNDLLDNGVVDVWRLELGGYALESVAGKTEVWAFPRVGLGSSHRTPPVHAVVHPRHRRYWRSKQRNEQI